MTVIFVRLYLDRKVAVLSCILFVTLFPMAILIVSIIMIMIHGQTLWYKKCIISLLFYTLRAERFKFISIWNAFRQFHSKKKIWNLSITIIKGKAGLWGRGRGGGGRGRGRGVETWLTSISGLWSEQRKINCIVRPSKKKTCFTSRFFKKRRKRGFLFFIFYFLKWPPFEISDNPGCIPC